MLSPPVLRRECFRAIVQHHVYYTTKTLKTQGFCVPILTLEIACFLRYNAREVIHMADNEKQQDKAQNNEPKEPTGHGGMLPFGRAAVDA